VTLVTTTHQGIPSVLVIYIYQYNIYATLSASDERYRISLLAQVNYGPRQNM
jgi:hypothetical protein